MEEEVEHSSSGWPQDATLVNLHLKLTALAIRNAVNSLHNVVSTVAATVRRRSWRQQ
jgi:hypothetical protein